MPEWRPPGYRMCPGWLRVFSAMGPVFNRLRVLDEWCGLVVAFGVDGLLRSTRVQGFGFE